MKNFGYYCPKCACAKSFSQVYAHNAMISDVYCKRCGSVIKFVEVSERKKLSMVDRIDLIFNEIRSDLRRSGYVGKSY